MMDDAPDTCMFCDIVDGTSAADVVFADGVAVAFLDRRPLFRGHTLVVPARHVVQLTELPADQVGPYFARVQLLATIVPTALDVPGTFVAMNNIVSQSVAHLHTHVVPRRRGDGLRGFFWPRQQYTDGQSIEYADRLRTALVSFDVENFLADR
jgi:histidine triad (HIT) family protein